MILFAIVLLTVVSISLRISILGLEATVFVINRADDIRKVGETALVQSTRLKGKKVYRTARTIQFGVDVVAKAGRTVINVGKKATIFAVKQSLKLIRFIVSRLRDLLVALETVVIVLDIVIFLILVSVSAGYMVLYCTTNEEGQIVYNEDVLAGLGVSSSTSEELGSESASGATNSGNFTKYDLSTEELQKLARLCYQEQGSVEGAAAEASLMCNLYESSRGDGYSSVYDYARNSGWFASAASHMDSGTASDDIVKVVTAVIKDGKRVLPKYVDEHDCISDIASATNNGTAITTSNRSDYQQHVTKIKNVYGSSYTFYCFPTSTSDPFGYTNESLREQYGDDCYSIESLKIELGL